MSPKYEAQLVGNRIIIWDVKQGTKLYSNGFYGKPIGVRKPNKGDEFRDPCEISLFESLYLLEKKKLDIYDESGKKITKKLLLEKCKDSYMNFDNKMAVYRYLRDLNCSTRIKIWC
ncbi:MAG: hypothetical protein ACTSRO_07055 [Candidatus Heimdallarchaeaceae archaeon]